MKNLSTYLALLLVTLYSCQQEDSDLSELQGIVRFGSISLEFAPMGSPGSRISGVSPWVHVFSNSADIIFTNKVTNEEFKLEYNPNDFTTPYSISLPFGSYLFYTKVEAGVFSDFLPFEASGEFILDSQSLEISLKATTDYGLVTVKDQYVEKASISDGLKESDLGLHEDCDYWFIYVKGETAATLLIKESFQGSSIVKKLKIVPNTHYNFILKLMEGSAAITDLSIEPFELEEEEILIGSSSKFFEENGTIKCPGAILGEKGMVDGKVYEAVDRALLITRRDEGADLSCVCTSLVTDMSRMFSYDVNFREEILDFNQNISSWDVSAVTTMEQMFQGASSFNQQIGNWDVSSVTNMRGMFINSGFNQPLGNWDVINVEDMSIMFAVSSFNQPIDDWDVSNVTNMSGMFSQAWAFNQPLSNWDVSNVINMSGMFNDYSSFNQPIGNWDVGNVTYMGGMFSDNSSFNQPIGDWDVSKVTNMAWMFSGGMSGNRTSFNQPIGNWDVGNVTFMDGMFFWSNFNQNLTTWCVKNIPSEPIAFSSEVDSFIQSNKPIWGTCPD